MLLVEKEAEGFLKKQGFNVIETKIARRRIDLESIASKIKFPWVMKISSSKIVHKNKIGGVILGINNLYEAEKAFHKLVLMKDFEEAIVQPMISGFELIIGIKNASEFGHVIMVGKGGSDVEKIKDVSFRVIPISNKDVKEMIQDLKCYKDMKKEKININSIEKNIMKINALAGKYKKIDELDINPLIVDKKQALIVDARLVFSS